MNEYESSVSKILKIIKKTLRPAGTSLPINRDVPLEREDTRSPGICVFEEDISTLEFNKKILE